jgi:hypothetical protein
MKPIKFNWAAKISAVLVALTMQNCEFYSDKKETALIKKDTLNIIPKQADISEKETALPKLNDTLNELAYLISGNKQYSFTVFKKFTDNEAFQNFSNDFTKRWLYFDSSRLNIIKNFADTILVKELINSERLFYPFSGPDILYATTLFPNIKHYTLIGLEPVGTLPILDDKNIVPDSINNYFTKINSSLNSILRFSFFRTVAMKQDLRNEDLDGLLHLILLFLNRTNNSIVSVYPFYIDSLGNKQYLLDFNLLKSNVVKNKSLEINFITKDHELKSITYTSTNLSDETFKKNSGLNTYLTKLNFNITYLKGASYLLHKTNFDAIRNLILRYTNQLVQDDSGIAQKYIFNDSNKWKYSFYGNYTKPINMFKNHYQSDLDSLYKKVGTKKLGFGLGYNYRDKNSNFMVITKIS